MVAMLSAACANQVPLTGGPKDEVPPQLDTIKSKRNYITEFTKQDIDLYFNEYVDLKDGAKQIVISPPLENPPKISSRLKKLSIAFADEEILKDDATYVINFGKAIRDFTESNVLQNYTYVFSTGTYIDSLSLSGKVKDAKTGKPKEDALILLYIENRDSIIYQERPFYFARTDEEGNYRINNLRPDTFKVMALLDENLNYLYDPGIEEIGFLDSVIILRDTLTSGINLEIFKEADQASYKSYDVLSQGKARVDFEGIVDSSSIRLIDTVDHLITYEEDASSLLLWYRPRGIKSLSYEVQRRGILDTVQLRVNTRNIDTLEGNISMTGPKHSAKIGLHPALPLSLGFDRPVANVNPAFITLVDTLGRDTLSYGLDTMEEATMTVALRSEWPVEKVLRLTMLPGAITDYYGKSHDTIESYVRIAQESDFGTIELSMVNFDSINYVLILEKDDKRISRVNFDGAVASSEDIITFERLPPGDYKVNIIFDEVPNGRWDPGDYLDKRQSESIYELSLAALRANWVLEEQINIGNLSQPRPSTDEIKDLLKMNRKEGR